MLTHVMRVCGIPELNMAAVKRLFLFRIRFLSVL